MRRIDIASLDRRDIAERNGAGGAGKIDQCLADLVERLKIAGWLDDELAKSGLDLAARSDGVLRLERVDQLLVGDAQLMRRPWRFFIAPTRRASSIRPVVPDPLSSAP